jgi:hypothetical protein
MSNFDYTNEDYKYSSTDSDSDDLGQNYGTELTEEQMVYYFPSFNSQTEYLFVNKCLSIMHGPLPNYAYFQSNDEVVNFWDELEDQQFIDIYYYLIENEYIDEHQDFDNTIQFMKNQVIDFVYYYFENRH